MLSFLLAAWAILITQQSAASTQGLAVYSVSGAVVNSVSAEPVPEAEVTLAPQFHDAQAQTVESDFSGRFTFLGVVPGRYTLGAQRRGFASQNYMQHGQFFSAVVVGPDLDTSNLSLALTPEGAISGHVYSSDGDPIRHAQIRILAGEPGRTGQPSFRAATATDDEGHYRAGRLTPGTYYLSVTADPWYARSARPILKVAEVDPDGSNPRQVFRPNSEPGSPDPRLDVSYPATYFSNATDIASAQPIELSPGEVQTADVTLTAVPSRHLIVSIPPKQNEFPTFLTLAPGRGFFRGIYASQIAPGVWELAGLPPGPFDLGVLSSDGHGGPQHLRRISLGNETELNLSAPGSGAHVKGTILSEAGFKLARASINLSQAGLGIGTADVSADGSFEFSGTVDPGEYSVMVNADSPHFLTRLSATGAKVSGRTIDIGSTDVQLAVTISAANAEISGYAVRDAKRVAGTLVALLPETPGRDVAPVRFYQSDGDGSFRFQNVVPGQYKLVALDGAWSAPDWDSSGYAKKFASQGKSVSVMAGGEAKIDLPVINVSKAPPAAQPAAQHNPH